MKTCKPFDEMFIEQWINCDREASEKIALCVRTNFSRLVHSYEKIIEQSDLYIILSFVSKKYFHFLLYLLYPIFNFSNENAQIKTFENSHHYSEKLWIQYQNLRYNIEFSRKIIVDDEEDVRC